MTPGSELPCPGAANATYSQLPHECEIGRAACGATAVPTPTPPFRGYQRKPKRKTGPKTTTPAMPDQGIGINSQGFI